MSPRRTPSEVGDIHIDQAVRAAKPPAVVGGIGGEHILHIPWDRDVPQPEPVTWRDLNGRPPGGWDTRFGFALFPPADGGFEEDAIVAARERERRQEWRP